MIRKAGSVMSHTMVQYTIISLIITFVIAYALINTMISNSEDYSVKIHTEVFLDYVHAIPTNYSDIIHELKGEDFHVFTEEEEEEHTHHHDERAEETENDQLIHFVTDLLVFPTIQQVTIYSDINSSIYSYSKNRLTELPIHKELLANTFNGDIQYNIQQVDSGLILHSFIPIIEDNNVLGVVYISDSDEHFTRYIEESNRDIFTSIVIGGFVFYMMLFVLFFKAVRSQNKALQKLNKSQELTINAMSILAELRDDDTGTHIIRTREYCKIVAEELRKDRKYKSYITDEYIEDLTRSAPLHDIGKVGISDSILLKPGKLTDEEFEEMKKHPELGSEVMHRVSDDEDFKSYFTLGIEVILHHHENWDGSGYPHKLSGEEIPLSARIMALSDVYDALRTTRPYKTPFTHEKAMEIIISESGRKFDPDIISVFVKLEKEFEKISDSV